MCTPCTGAFLPDRRKRRQKHHPFRHRRAQPGTDRVSLSEAPRRPGKTACIHRILDHGKFKRHQPVFHRRKHRSVPDLSGWDVPVVPTDPPALSGRSGRAAARRKCDANPPDRPLIATLAASSVISMTGLISFISLLAPHGARLLFKNNRLSTMLFSGLLGGCLLTLGDIFARSIASTELPVSIFTSLLGAPFLIYLCIRRKPLQ